MTALVAVPSGPVRPVPWPRLAWVSWRRYRTTFAATVGLLALIATYLVIDGQQARSAYAKYLDCSPADSAECQFIWENFRDSYGDPGLLGVILALLPGIVGAFAGAPVLAREFETGTFRYAWTQGVGRMRWAVAMLVPGAVGAAVIMAAFGGLAAWHDQPLVQAGLTPRLQASIFPTAGLAVVGWVLIGFALGVVAGLLWRRVLPALATAFAAWFGLALLTADYLRPNYLAQLVGTPADLSSADVVFARWWTKDGVRVSDDEINSMLHSIGLHGTSGEITVVPGGATGRVEPSQYLFEHGYTQMTSYQPGTRYWPFQWIEFGWLAATSLLLLGLVFWLLRRRPA
jgi:hypothetical protein